jgi:hypothetical protein
VRLTITGTGVDSTNRRVIMEYCVNLALSLLGCRTIPTAKFGSFKNCTYIRVSQCWNENQNQVAVCSFPCKSFKNMFKIIVGSLAASKH